MEYTDKDFYISLREILKERKITYERLASISKVSKTYLTDILVHKRIPSKEIIEKICDALHVTPEYFKEYRILKIDEKLREYSHYLKLKDLDKFDNLLSDIKKRIPGEYVSWLSYFKGGRSESFEPKNIIILDMLEDHQQKILRYIIKQFRETNEKELTKDLDEIFIANSMDD